ncbi:hypothetical protein AA0118_g11306 [Alternaria tenuissima]|nr:hypothetical protein AA0118_g11306 [Alternaria tenuissima]
MWILSSLALPPSTPPPSAESVDPRRGHAFEADFCPVVNYLLIASWKDREYASSAVQSLLNHCHVNKLLQQRPGSSR